MRHPSHQVALNLPRLRLPSEAQTLRESLHVRIDGEAFIFSKHIAQHHVRRLSAHAGQCRQFRHGLRHNAAVLFH